ncbi:ABC transporter substrate-binding protein [uncultured Megasphaera sp.]|uniref:ABC transporter substrate-binding protein n=1 Tax=uncultured Megasphaera sp. TaxID=165188 RepID=UPI00265CA762|nr:ABC transporter substrate-binding protein [uncultured Megasphaera sp.]
MRTKRWLLWAGLCLCLFALFAAGCAPQNAATAQERDQADGAYAVITDDMGRNVRLAEKPRRVVVLSTSLLNMADALDGELAGRATVKAEDAELPGRYAAVPDVGPVYNVSVEKIIELQPNLVVASEVQHQKLVSLLEQNGIPVIALRSKTYDDVKRNLAVFGTIYGKKETAEARAAEMDEAIEAIVAKAPQDHKKVAIIHATPSSVTVQLETSIAGCAAKMLHLDNVAADAQTSGTMEKVPYSMEALAEKDPDIIFFTSMGPAEKIEERIRQDVMANPAWATLRAVKAGKVYVLPERYFLLNPGLDYPDAVAYMARLAYPEAFS